MPIQFEKYPPSMEPDFIPGLELSRQFYWEKVRPLLDAHFPGIPHSAALIGVGSEVLGFDSLRSTDHDWGPRVMLFLPKTEYSSYSKVLEEVLRKELPASFHGYPIIPRSKSRETTGFEIHTICGYLLNYLDFDIQNDLEPADWLTFPEQKLLSFTKGTIHWDGAGLEEVRQKFKYYPLDVWLYLLAAAWNRVGQEEHLMGRAGQVGDEIGSTLIAARLVRDLMRLWFLMERQYAPYAKWFGTAFARLEGSRVMLPVLQKVLASSNWEERQEHLAEAYEMTAVKHNTLKITDHLNEKRSYFFDRPFLIIDGERFADAITAQINDPSLIKLARMRLIGSIDQISDSTDLLCGPQWRKILRKLYE